MDTTPTTDLDTHGNVLPAVSSAAMADKNQSSKDSAFESSTGEDEKQHGEEATGQPDELGHDEYPSGIKMFFIVVALVLSVFLFALDLVSLEIFLVSPGIALTWPH